jgi:hypothetical protein
VNSWQRATFIAMRRIWKMRPLSRRDQSKANIRTQRSLRLRNELCLHAHHSPFPLNSCRMWSTCIAGCSIYIQLSLRVEPLTVTLEDATNILYNVYKWQAAARNDTRSSLYFKRNIHSSSFTTSTNLRGACCGRNIIIHTVGSVFQRSRGRSRVKCADILTSRSIPGRLSLG